MLRAYYACDQAHLITFESRAQAAKRKAIRREGVWRRGPKIVTFSSRGFASRFRARKNVIAIVATVTLLTMRRFHVLATSAILSDTNEQPAPSRAILFESLFIISKRTRDAWSALHCKNNNNTYYHITI